MRDGAHSDYRLRLLVANSRKELIRTDNKQF